LLFWERDSCGKDVKKITMFTFRRTKMKPKRKTTEKPYCKIILTVFFFFTVFKLPAIHHVQLSQINGTNLSDLASLIDDNVHKIDQQRRSTVLRWDNFVLLSISTVLVIVFSIINQRETPRQNDGNRRWSITILFLFNWFQWGKFCILGIVEPIRLFDITDRNITAIIVAVQMFEILEILEETLIDIKKSAESGVLIGICKRIFFVFLIASVPHILVLSRGKNIFYYFRLRYYPILASLQFRHIAVRLLTALYVTGTMAYMTIRESSSMHWVAFLMKTSPSAGSNIYIVCTFDCLFHRICIS
jgi:hypothetical protein